MSIKPIETVVKCDKCYHSWVEIRNTLDLIEKCCPNCNNKVLVF